MKPGVMLKPPRKPPEYNSGGMSFFSSGFQEVAVVITGCWLFLIQPIWKNVNEFESFPQIRGEHKNNIKKKYVKPPHYSNHLGYVRKIHFIQLVKPTEPTRRSLRQDSKTVLGQVDGEKLWEMFQLKHFFEMCMKNSLKISLWQNWRPKKQGCRLLTA